MFHERYFHLKISQLFFNGALNFIQLDNFSISISCQQVKWPRGKRFEDKFVETLKKYGYKGSYMSEDWLKQPVFIQSFAPTSLIYASNLTDSPKIFLIDDITIPTQDTNQVSTFTSLPVYSSHA